MTFVRIDKDHLFDFNIIFGQKSLSSSIGLDFYKKRYESINSLYNKINWIHANPSSDDTIKHTEKIYINTNKRAEIINDLKNRIESNEKLIFIEGKRGSGKTFLQNYF